MTNLLEETKSAIIHGGKTISDVLWVGSHDGKFAIDWPDFEKIANVEYDAGFGAQEVASDLVVVFKDGSLMTRGEYDGSEWWEHPEPAIRQPNSKPFGILTVRQWNMKVAGKEHYDFDDYKKTLDTKVGWDKLEDLNP